MLKQATFLSVLVLMPAALATPAFAHEAGVAEVEVVDIAYMPSAVAIEPGETVVWNHPATSDAHNVRFDTPLFESPADPSPLQWTASLPFPAVGEYRYYCEEHVGEGMSGTVFVTPTGSLPAGAPTASFTVSPGNPGIGQPVTFNAAASSDPTPGESVVKYDWDLDGNGTYETPTANRPTATGTYNTAGLRKVALRVTDTRGLTGETVREFSVAGSPEPPPPPPPPPAPFTPPVVTPPVTGGQTPQPAQIQPVSSTVTLLSSRRLKTVLRRGLRFEAGVPSNGATVRASLSARGRTLGTLRRSNVSRGRVKLTLKLSRRGKASLKKLLANRRRIATVMKVTAGNKTTRARVTISR